MKRKLLAIALTFLLIFTAAPASYAEADIPTFKIAASLSLESEIYVYFDVAVEGTASGDICGMLFWSSLDDFANSVNSKDVSGTQMSDSEMGSFMRYKKSFSAKEMSTLIYAQAYVKRGDDTYYSSLIPYSVHTYAARKLGYCGDEYKTTDTALSELLVGLVNYGSLAQTYFSNDAPKADKFMENGHTHSVSNWVVTDTKTKMGVCSTCGLVQKDVIETEQKPAELQTAEVLYAELDDCCWVIGISGSYSGDVKVEILSEYNGKPVTVINENAFKGHSEIKEVYIPSSIIEIYSGAFSGTSLEKAEFEVIDGWTVYDLTSKTFISIDLSAIGSAKALSDTYAATAWKKD